MKTLEEHLPLNFGDTSFSALTAVVLEWLWERLLQRNKEVEVCTKQTTNNEEQPVEMVSTAACSYIFPSFAVHDCQYQAAGLTIRDTNR